MIDRAEINRAELKLPCQSSTLPWIPQAKNSLDISKSPT